MKSISSLLIFNFILTVNTYSQDVPPPPTAFNETSFGVFIASPVGAFKSTSLNNGGFAKSGGGIVFDSKYSTQLLPKNWSFIFHSTYQWNDMDTQEIGRLFTATLGQKTVVSDSKYSPILTTVGVQYDFPLADRISFGLKGSLGIMFNNTKAFTIKVYDSGDNLVLNELVNFDNKVAFAYMGGAEFRFEIVKNVFGITLYSDYTSASQTMDLSFTTLAPISSFQDLLYWNTGFRLTFIKPAAPARF